MQFHEILVTITKKNVFIFIFFCITTKTSWNRNKKNSQYRIEYYPDQFFCSFPIGGNDGTMCLQTGEKFNPRRNVWEPIASMHSRRFVWLKYEYAPKKNYISFSIVLILCIKSDYMVTLQNMFKIGSRGPDRKRELEKIFFSHQTRSKSLSAIEALKELKW